jgi:prophage regulatory protein
MNTTKQPRRIILDPEVKQVTGLSRTSRWRMIERGEFPAPVRLSSGRVGFFEDEVADWQSKLLRATESKKPMPVSPGRSGSKTSGVNHG